ncbi:piggyBac transposable element-derived protein 2-like [Homalodisca vitripennis]|uniref:piggyBac transposable element-derived protein 2-like n=1 Tax=Homalodisca vitripennis TaxID=197043 RepID=UPI001EECCB86|nr:piggyBac transposable element-derived protein 2-like [Homalodisca vitripennis]
MNCPLSANLLANGKYCTGTLRTNRKHLPDAVKEAKLGKGETLERYADGVMVAKWRDKRTVTYMSTEFENVLVTSNNRHNVAPVKPLPIVQYNAHMKGVDWQNQMLAYYPCEHKSLRWYKKIFVHVIEMMLINAFKLHQLANPRSNKPLYNFRL